MKDFAHADSVVATFLEILWDRGEVAHSVSPVVAVIFIYAKRVRPAACQERCPAGSAEGLLCVCICEEHAILSQAVNGRCQRQLVAIAA